MSIRKISSREIYRNKWVRFYEDVIERDVAEGKTERGIYAVLEKDPAAILIPLDRDASGEEYVWLVSQYRYTIKERFWELPQGGWEEAGVDVEELARGELHEETGIKAGRMTRLGMHWIAYGAMHQEHHVFLAEDLTRGDIGERDAEEHDLEIKRVSVREFESMVLRGEIRDNCTVAAWGLYKIWRERGNS